MTDQLDGYGAAVELFDIAKGHPDRVRNKETPWVRLLSIALLLVGTALVVIGLEGDAQAWWSTRPFLTNLLTGAAGACFGIPIALQAIQAINRSREQLEARRRTLIKLKGLAEKLHAQAADLFAVAALFQWSRMYHALVDVVKSRADGVPATWTYNPADVRRTAHVLQMDSGAISLGLREIDRTLQRVQNLAEESDCTDSEEISKWLSEVPGRRQDLHRLLDFPSAEWLQVFARFYPLHDARIPNLTDQEQELLRSAALQAIEFIRELARVLSQLDSRGWMELHELPSVARSASRKAPARLP